MSDNLSKATRIVLLLVCLTAVALLGTSAFAQEPTTEEVEESREEAVADETPVVAGEIVVTAVRLSMRNNIETKREADTVVDAITAEEVGKFPDKNVAESLQRVPGVTIQRQWGEGAAVAVRGAGEDLTLTTLNGQNVASTGWFVFEPARRSFNYSLLPSEMISSVEVYKGSQANLPEGGVGGTVIIKTREPLDLDPMTVFGSVEMQHSSDSDEWDPGFSGLVSWKNDSETFGVLGAFSVQDRTLQRNGNEAFWQWGAGPVAFVQDRERSAYDLTAQFRPTERLNITAHVLHMEMEANNTNYALWLTQLDAPWISPELSTEHLPSDPTVPIAGPLNVAYWQARPREATMESEVYDLDLEYLGDNFVLHAQIGRTEASGGTDFESVFDDGTGGTPIPGGTYDFTSGHQTWDLAGFSYAYDPGTVVMGSGEAFNRTPKIDEEDYAQLDLSFPVDYGIINEIETGVKYSEHLTESRRYLFETAPDANFRINTADFAGGTIDAGAAGVSIMRLDSDKLLNFAKSLVIGQTEDLSSFQGVEEDNIAAYAMAHFNTQGVRGNFGVRYVHTDASSDYYIRDEVSGELLPQRADADYGEFLPSMNLTFDLTDQLLLRTSLARVMSRPQYVDMYMTPDRSGVDPNIDTNPFLITGNVALKPFLAYQADISTEWYYAPGSFFSVGVFRKDIESFIKFETEFDVFIDDPVDPGLWNIQQKVNGAGGTIEGFEFQWMHDFDNGFGFILNLTKTDTEVSSDTFDDRNPDLTDSSDLSYNITAYFENRRMHARLSYNWRDEYLMREPGAYGNRLHDEYGTLDGSFSFHLTRNFDIHVEAMNILEEESQQFGANNLSAGAAAGSGFSEGFPLYEYEMGRRIFVGTRFRF